MSLKYVTTKRVFGFDKSKAEKFVVRTVNMGEVTFEKLCKKLSLYCGVHRGVVQQVVAGLVDVMTDELEEGKSVRLGEFGVFRPTVKAMAVDEEKNANASSIKRVKVLFSPGKSLKQALQDTPVTRYGMPDTDWTDGGNSGGNTGGGGGGWEDPNA